MRRRGITAAILTVVLGIFAALVWAAPSTAEAEVEQSYTGMSDGYPYAVIYLPVQVDLIGRDWLSTDSFTLNVAASDSNSEDVVPVPSTVTVTDGGVTTFGSITVTLPGTYTYQIWQTPGNTSEAYGSMTFGASGESDAQTVTVTVSENSDGTFSVTQPATTVIQNTFTPDDIYIGPMGTEISFYGEYTGTNQLPENFFSYVLEADTADTGYMLWGGAVVGTWSQTVTASYEPTNQPVKLSFNQTLIVTKPGTYLFKLYVQIPSDQINAASANASYKENPVYIAVNVTESPEGELSAKVGYGESADGPFDYDNLVTIKNDYENDLYGAASGTVTRINHSATFDVSKTLEGRDSKDDEAYTFTITPDTYELSSDTAGNMKSPTAKLFGGNVNGPEIQTVSISDLKDGVAQTVEFPEKYYFNAAGTYTFKVVENVPDPADPDMTYDSEPQYITVVVTTHLDDQGFYAYDIDVTSTGTKDDPVAFKNVYTAPKSDTGAATDLDKDKTGSTVTDDKKTDTTSSTTDDKKTGVTSTTTDDKKSDSSTSDAKSGSATSDEKSNTATSDDKKSDDKKSDDATSDKTDKASKDATASKGSTKTSAKVKAASATKVSATPKTSDATQPLVILGIAVAGVAVIAVAWLLIKKRRQA